MKLSWLAGLVGLPEDAQDEKVATALEARVTLAKGLESEVSALKTSLEQANAQAQALEARAKQAEAARDGALLALESLPPPPVAPEPVAAPAPAGKFKAGDKVMYREQERGITSAMGPEMVYEFEGGECGPESRCQSMASPVAVAFAGNHRVLTAYAARVAGHTMSAENLRSLAMATANGSESLPDVLAKIDASVPANTQAKAVARGVLEALAPQPSAKPSMGASDRQSKIRNRIQGGN